MGRQARERPKRLAEKLLKIRERLGLSQNQMLSKLGLDEKLSRTAISGYELGTNGPPLLILLTYSKIAGIHLEVLVDDEMELPNNIPSMPS
jgi:transcriptional regulator with XRE-family HTH domain